jgi:hypothetical protein
LRTALPPPDTAMIFVRGNLDRISRMVSRPSVTGMKMSVMTASAGFDS